MRKSTRYSLLVTLALLSALVIALFLRKQAPPEVARLLPESDAIVYLNLKPLRLATHFEKSPVMRSPDYESFINATGIVFERDLDAAAFALHRMDDPTGPNGPVAYSEVFEGRFDGARLARYLGQIATARESYAGHDIYTIPVAFEVATPTSGKPSQPAAHPVRFLRVTQLGYDTIAASNMPTAEQIHSILDRFRASASPFAGSSLLEARYRDVPLLSSAWAIGHIGLPFSENGHITAFGLQLPMPEDTTFVASARYTGQLHLRIDEILATEDDAARSTAALSALIDLFRSFERLQQNIRASQPSSDPNDAALHHLIDSVKIQQQKDRAVLTATLPIDLLKQLTNAH
jgi:hypothetical protein